MAKRSYGTGRLYVVVDRGGRSSWYGSWWVGGTRVKRKIGLKRTAGEADGLTRTMAERELRRVVDATTVVAKGQRRTVGLGLLALPLPAGDVADQARYVAALTEWARDNASDAEVLVRVRDEVFTLRETLDTSECLTRRQATTRGDTFRTPSIGTPGRAQTTPSELTRASARSSAAARRPKHHSGRAK